MCDSFFAVAPRAQKCYHHIALQWSNGAALWPMTWKWMGTDIFQLNVTCVYCVCVTVLSFSCRQANNFCHRRETNSMESRKAFLWSLFGGAINLQIRSTCGMNGRHREYFVTAQVAKYSHLLLYAFHANLRNNKNAADAAKTPDVIHEKPRISEIVNAVKLLAVIVYFSPVCWITIPYLDIHYNTTCIIESKRFRSHKNFEIAFTIYDARAKSAVYTIKMGHKSDGPAMPGFVLWHILPSLYVAMASPGIIGSRNYVLTCVRWKIVLRFHCRPPLCLKYLKETMRFFVLCCHLVRVNQFQINDNGALWMNDGAFIRWLYFEHYSRLRDSWHNLRGMGGEREIDKHRCQPAYTWYTSDHKNQKTIDGIDTMAATTIHSRYLITIKMWLSTSEQRKSSMG